MLKTEPVLAIAQQFLIDAEHQGYDLTKLILGNGSINTFAGSVRDNIIQGPRHLFEADGLLKDFAHFCTYVLFYDTKGEEGGRRYFQYERTNTSGESLLKGCRSLGVGGHVNTELFNEGESVISCCFVAAIREALEEINVTEGSKESMGRIASRLSESGGVFFYHPVNPVSRVHVCYTDHIEVDDVTLLVPAENKLKAIEPFVPGVSDASLLEAWSVKALEVLTEREGVMS